MQVCVIREQRLDQEDVIADISKSCDQAKKEQETLKQKLKRIEQSLAATETDIREFQQEKQASLNEIDVMVMLYAHQIEYLVDGRLPMDLNGAVVFSNKELARLRRRIDVRLQHRASTAYTHDDLALLSLHTNRTLQSRSFASVRTVLQHHKRCLAASALSETV